MGIDTHICMSYKTEHLLGRGVDRVTGLERDYDGEMVYTAIYIYF